MSSVAYHNTNVLLHSSGVQKSKMDHTGLKLSCQKGCVLLEAQEGNMFT